MPRRKSVNPYDLNAISEADHPNRMPRSRNPRDENPYSLTKERNLRGIPVEETKAIYLVVYSNYWPLEFESIWSTFEAAQQRADELVGDWRVAERLLNCPSEDAARSLLDNPIL